MTEPRNTDRAWARWGLFGLDTGSLHVVGAPGVMAGWAGRTAFVRVGDHIVCIHDTRDEYLPFNPDKPDCRGFRVGPFFVALNCGKATDTTPSTAGSGHGKRKFTC